MECFRYNYTIIHCLLTIFVHNYYAQPIYYTDVSKLSKSLSDWSIPLRDGPPTTLPTELRVDMPCSGTLHCSADVDAVRGFHSDRKIGSTKYLGKLVQTATEEEIHWYEYLLGIFIKYLGSCWLHRLNDGSSISNYTCRTRSLSLRWRQVLQACQKSLMVPSLNLPPSESAGGHAWFSC